MDRFYAKVNQGIVHNQTKGKSRQGRWIEARDIPLDFLRDYGTPKTHPMHPHNVEGMAWDLDVNMWRIVKNASAHSLVVDQVTYDPQDDRLFYL